MKILVLIVIVTCIIFYLQCLFRYKDEINIIQSDLDSLNPDLLFELQPIYIETLIANPADLFNTLFKYLYQFKELSLSNSKILKRNLSKYLLIYNDTEKDVNVKIIPPKYNKQLSFEQKCFYFKNFNICKNDLTDNKYETDLMNENIQIINIILKPKNIVILPLHWSYQTSEDNILEIHLFDIITKVYSIF